MSRLIGPTLGLVLLGIVVGFVLGLAIAYLNPVRFVNADPSSLRPDIKEDYVRMVGAAFALDNSLADAKANLSRIEPNSGNAARLVATLAERAIDDKDARNARNLSLLAVALGSATPKVREFATGSGAPTPTAVPTFTPAPTRTPAALLVETPTATALPTAPPPPATATSVPATATATQASPTNTPVPPQPTPTRRPPTNTPPPTEPPKPSIDFKVIEQRLWGAVENGGVSSNGSVQSCGNLNTFFIKVIDKNGNPLDGIIVKRGYVDQVQVRPTGAKGPGKTEDDTGAGNKFRVVSDTAGREYTSEWTRDMSTLDPNIPNSDLIAGGYCKDDAECNSRKNNIQLCYRHYSYSVTFQRQW